MIKPFFTFNLIILVSCKLFSSEIFIPFKYSDLQPDSIELNQGLYVGKKWNNIYRNYEGDQFLFSNIFLPGSVTISSKTFNNIKIKYDILSDEILTPVSLEDIVQLNKEMVDSFSIKFNGITYRFKNILNDSLPGFSGYLRILYTGKIGLYIKYSKSVSSVQTSKSDGYFTQKQFLYCRIKNLIYPLKNINSIYEIFRGNESQIKDFMNTNHIVLSRKVPESFIPLIRFCDNLPL